MRARPIRFVPLSCLRTPRATESSKVRVSGAGLLAATILTVLFTNPSSAKSSRAATPREATPAHLSNSDWTAIRNAHALERHAVRTIDGGFEARNPRQQWTTRFDGRGFSTTPITGSWTWGLELVSYGIAGVERPVDDPSATRVNGSGLAYVWDSILEEWYRNDARGLEHGFTVCERPPGGTGPLSLTLLIRGDLVPLAHADGRSVDFTTHEIAVVTYGGLLVLDAYGRELPAKLEVLDGLIRYTVEESGARYPLTIDPIAQQAYLKASNAEGGLQFFTGDSFGGNVAVSGDTVVVGAPKEDCSSTGVNGDQSNNFALNSGAVYVFQRTGASWSQQAYLKASNTGDSDTFGDSVAISGDTIVVGASGEDGFADSLPASGAVYVFVRNGGIWSQQAYLKASNKDSTDRFGTGLAISGDTVVVGANQEDSNATGVDGDPSNNAAPDSGAAYVFERSGEMWTQTAYLKASNTGSNDYFGIQVDISGDTIVVSAMLEDSDATGVNGDQSNNSKADSGAVYVFVRSGSNWIQQAYLKASDTGGSDFFGASVSISGNSIIVGAPYNHLDAFPSAGAAYVFHRTGTAWAQQAFLTATNKGPGDEFGRSVAIAGDMALIGAIGEDSNATGVNGNGADNSASQTGAAYVFKRYFGLVWIPQAYLKASNPDINDEFGRAVAIAGETMLVGTYFESSAAVGVNGNQADNSAYAAGACYVFDFCSSDAATTSYGTGKAGSFGTPALSSTNPPKLGTMAELKLSGGLPGASGVFLFAGISPASLSFDDGSLLVNPFLILPLPSLDGAGSLTLAVPLTTWACGASLYLQAMFVDPGATGPYSTAQTNGLHLTLGG
jgi:hypothetical protein